MLWRRVVASGLLNILVAGIGVVLVAWLVCRVAGRDSSRTRFSGVAYNLDCIGLLTRELGMLPGIFLRSWNRPMPPAP